MHLEHLYPIGIIEKPEIFLVPLSDQVFTEILIRDFSKSTILV